MGNATRPVGLAVIGAGMGAKPHFEALSDLADGRVAFRSVYVRDAARRAEVAAQQGVAAADSIEAIAADPSVDAVLMVTPPNARVEIVDKLAAAGKAILMEKPVERTTAAAVGIVETMERAGLPLGIVFQHRMKDSAQAARALLESGRLGRIALVRLDVPWWRPQSYYDEPGRGTLARDGGGVLISQAIHPLDMMLSLLGPVDEVQALTGTTALHQMETEDFAAAGLKFRNGAFGQVMATTAAFPGAGETLAIEAENGSALLSEGKLAIRWRSGETEIVGEEAGSGGGADPMAFDRGPHRAVIEDFTDALVEGRAPAITGRSALNVHRLIDAIMESSASGRRVRVAE